MPRPVPMAQCKQCGMRTAAPRLGLCFACYQDSLMLMETQTDELGVNSPTPETTGPRKLIS